MLDFKNNPKWKCSQGLSFAPVCVYMLLPVISVLVKSELKMLSVFEGVRFALGREESLQERCVIVNRNGLVRPFHWTVVLCLNNMFFGSSALHWKVNGQEGCRCEKRKTCSKWSDTRNWTLDMLRAAACTCSRTVPSGGYADLKGCVLRKFLNWGSELMAQISGGTWFKS